MDFLDITDYVLVEEVDDEAEAGARPSVPARDEQLTSACTGIVVHSLFGGRQSDAEVSQPAPVSLVWLSLPCCMPMLIHVTNPLMSCAG